MFDRDLSIYLDTEFVVRKYEEISKVMPATTITKTEDISADVGFLGMKAGAAVRESKMFSISSWRMLEGIWDDLTEYPEFSGSFSLKPNWFTGSLGMGCSEHTSTSSHISFTGDRKRETKKEVLGEQWYFGLRISDEHFLPLFTKQQFFTSGYDQMLANTHGPSTSVWVGVRMLAKVLFNNRTQDIVVATPYLIFSNEKEGQPVGMSSGVSEQGQSRGRRAAG